MHPRVYGFLTQPLRVLQASHYASNLFRGEVSPEHVFDVSLEHWVAVNQSKTRLRRATAFKHPIVRRAL
jgi:hypothetical protein